MNKKLTLSPGRLRRRAFMKATGISIALPSLESIAAPTRGRNGAPMWLVCISSALGMNPGSVLSEVLRARL
ncbi:MAG: hypothetical protein ABI614_21210 [Planctomycetota bacterium]